jgi:ankyrin repeat protein
MSGNVNFCNSFWNQYGTKSIWHTIPYGVRISRFFLDTLRIPKIFSLPKEARQSPLIDGYSIHRDTILLFSCRIMRTIARKRDSKGYLIKKGADVNARDSDGETALDHAENRRSQSA